MQKQSNTPKPHQNRIRNVETPHHEDTTLRAQHNQWAHMKSYTMRRNKRINARKEMRENGNLLLLSPWEYLVVRSSAFIRTPSFAKRKTKNRKTKGNEVGSI